ncbi:hypothetical protein ACJJTC_002926 [Scirpophaga incertulas]
MGISAKDIIILRNMREKGLLPSPASLKGPPQPFGWGVTVRNRDWSVPNLRVIALGPRVAQWLETIQTIPPCVYKTPVHALHRRALAFYKKFRLGKPLRKSKARPEKGEHPKKDETKDKEDEKKNDKAEADGKENMPRFGDCEKNYVWKN